MRDTVYFTLPVVEARYQKVETEKDGTVHLTIIPGKVKTINL